MEREDTRRLGIVPDKKGELSETEKNVQTETEVLDQLENQELSNLEDELYHPEPPIESEPMQEIQPHTYEDYLEFEADLLEDYMEPTERLQDARHSVLRPTFSHEDTSGTAINSVP